MKKYLLGFLTITLAVGLSVFSLSCGGGGGGGKCQKAIDSGIAADIIADCDTTKVTSEQARDAGLSLIAHNSPTEAKVLLATIPSTDPLYGEAQYGIMMTDLQGLSKDIDSLIGMVQSMTSMTSYETQQTGADLWPLISGSIDPIKARLVTLDTEAAAVIANGYTLSTDLPLVFGTSSGEYYITVELKGKAGNLEARAIKLVANLAIAGIEIIAAHDLTIDLSITSKLADLTDLLSGLTGGASSTDVVKALRGLGWLMADNQKLLTKSLTRWSTNMGDVPARWVAAIDALRELDADLIATAKSTADACKADMACLVSSDAAINAGDQLLINAVVHVEMKMEVSADMLSTLNALKTVLSSTFGVTLAPTTAGITVDMDLTNPTILALTPMLLDSLGRIIPTLDALLVKFKDSINTGAAITTADVNPMIEALDPTLPLLPEGIFTLKVKKFFEIPLRNITTYFECNTATTLPATGTGAHCLAIEIESVSNCTGITACSVGDAAHFAGMTEITPIAADGVAPKACAKLSTNKYPVIPPKGTIYVALKDPTLNGGLSLDLTKLPAPWTEAAAGSTDNYAFWKVMNYYLVEYAGKVEESNLSKQMREGVDIFMNALPAGTIPPSLTCP